MSGGGAILISDRINHHAVLTLLPCFKINKTVKNNGGLRPDLIFTECLPSLAVALIDFNSDRRQLEEIILQFIEIQKKFKNAYAIFLNCDIKKWNYFQLNTPGGSIHMLRCSNNANAAKNLMDIYSNLKDAKKLNLQKDFFERDDKKQKGSQTARAIAMKSLSKLGMPERDGQLILDGFPSLKTVIAADSDTLSLNSPADQSSIDKIFSFFSAANPGKYYWKYSWKD